MSSITEGQDRQYADSSKLAARARLHRDFGVSTVPWFSWVMRQLPLKRGDRVLDIGCGPGWFWAGAANDMPEGMHLTLVDQSAGMVEEAVKRCAPLGFDRVDGATADIVALPFADEQFDVVIAMHMLYHVADQAAAMAEMDRVIKPGGTLAVTTNGSANLVELYALTVPLGSDPVDPASVAFGYDKAMELMESQFGAVMRAGYPASLHVTDQEVVYLALTSYPPGETASAVQLDGFRKAIAEAFAAGGGALDVQSDMALFLSQKVYAMAPGLPLAIRGGPSLRADCRTGDLG